MIPGQHRVEQPLVSVVVPFYNVVGYVSYLLDSLLNQEFDQYEVVCIDDGSTDGTGALLDAYAAGNGVLKVYHFENAGLSVARNRGLSLARAELIAFVDGDDFVAPNYLSALYAAHEGVAGRLVQVGRRAGELQALLAEPWGQCFVSEKCLLRGIEVRKAFLQGKLQVSSWGCLARREFYERHPFPEATLYEDWHTTPDILGDVDEVVAIDAPLYAYVFRSGSITRPTEATETLPRQYLLAIKHATEVELTWEPELHPLVVWSGAIGRLSTSTIAMRVPDGDVGLRYLREASSYVRANLLRILGVCVTSEMPHTTLLMLRFLLLSASPRLYRVVYCAWQRLRELCGAYG